MTNILSKIPSKMRWIIAAGVLLLIITSCFIFNSKARSLIMGKSSTSAAVSVTTATIDPAVSSTAAPVVEPVAAPVVAAPVVAAPVVAAPVSSTAAKK
jgi:hypothetical protein